MNSIDFEEFSFNDNQRLTGENLRISINSSAMEDLLDENCLSEFEVKYLQRRERYNLEDLESCVLLGQESNGVVYLSYDKRLKNFVALKMVSVFDSTKREVIQKKLDSVSYTVSSGKKYIVGFELATYHQGTMYFGLEYMPGGSLKDVFDMNRTKKKRMDEACISIICKQVLESLIYMRNRDFKFPNNREVFRNSLKPSKILLGRNGNFRVNICSCDRIQERHFHPVKDLSMSYMSPEELNGLSSTSSETSVWRLGVIIFQLATGKFPYTNEEEGKYSVSFWQQLRWLKNNGPPRLSTEDGHSVEISDFVSKMLTMDVKDRYGRNQLLGHEFIKSHENNPESRGKYDDFWRNHMQENIARLKIPFHVFISPRVSSREKKEYVKERIDYLEQQQEDTFGIKIAGNNVLVFPKVLFLELEGPFSLKDVVNDLEERKKDREFFEDFFDEDGNLRKWEGCVGFTPTQETSVNWNQALDKLEF